MLSSTHCTHQNSHISTGGTILVARGCLWSISRPDTPGSDITHISGSPWCRYWLKDNISICFLVKSQWLIPRIWLAAVKLVQKDLNRTTNVHISGFSKLGERISSWLPVLNVNYSRRAHLNRKSIWAQIRLLVFTYFGRIFPEQVHKSHVSCFHVSGP